MNDLANFLKATCFERPDSRVPVKELFHRFRATLTPRDAKTWPRWRFVEEIGKLFPTGKDSDNVVFVGGLSLTNTRYVRTDDGRLRLAVA